ncbi:hypothetical protein GBA52_022451 [Prunus armeniaca]|nr:hypothetical protein GBA52_022451 [Prunus armeniaca]
MKFPVVFIYEDYKYYECYNMDYCSDMQRVKDVKCKIEKDSGIAFDQQKLFLVVGEDEHIGLETLEKGVFVVLPYPKVATVPDEEIGCHLGSSGGLDNPEVAAVSKEEIDIHLDSKELEQNCCPFLDFRTNLSENWVDIIIQQGAIVGAEDINQNVIVGECSAANQMVPAWDPTSLYLTQESNVASSSALAANHTDDASEKVVGNVREEHKIAVKVAIGRRNQYIINVYPSDKVSIFRPRLAQQLAELNIPMPETYHFVIGLNKVNNEELSIDDFGLKNNRVIKLMSNDE